MATFNRTFRASLLSAKVLTKPSTLQKAFPRSCYRSLATAVSGESNNYAIRPSNGESATFTFRNGEIHHGRAYGAHTNVSGEAVFTTSLVGYPESLTDPSYRGQILVFTQPLIGNYGVPSSERDEYGLLRYFESPNIQASGVVVADLATQYSHWTAVESLHNWCAREGVPIISGVDTRAIVTHLREQGSSLARISVGSSYDQDEDEAFIDPEQINLVRQVSTKYPFHVANPGSQLHIAILDCGIKENLIRSIVSRGASVTCFPYDYPIDKIMGHFDGLFISNGPGDPSHCRETVYRLQKIMEDPKYQDLPIFGVCLGHQLIAMAAGAKTVRLKHGNRAHNVPVLDTLSQKCLITSQNHGYAVDVETLPEDWHPLFINLNDSSNEGVMHKHYPRSGCQFHPEAKGGPLDSSYLFDEFLESVSVYKKKAGNREKQFTPLLIDILAKERVGVAPTTGMQAIARAGRDGEVGASAAGARVADNVI